MCVGKSGWFPASYVEFIDETAESEPVSRPLSVAAEPKKLSQQELLGRVVNEIITTEKDYLKNLTVVIEVRTADFFV